MQNWDTWIADRSYLASKFKGADPSNPEAYFLKLQALSEAFFRRTLFVGLRLNRVSFRESDDWLHQNDSTPSKDGFPRSFDRLYGPNLTFDKVLSGCQNGEALWKLWLEFAKPVRNNIAHGIRSYKADWLECGALINQHLMFELDDSLSRHIGGKISDDLSKINPRLPQGNKSVDISALIGKKANKPKASLSLSKTSNQLISIGILSYK